MRQKFYDLDGWKWKDLRFLSEYWPVERDDQNSFHWIVTSMSLSTVWLSWISSETFTKFDHWKLLNHGWSSKARGDYGLYRTAQRT